MLDAASVYWTTYQEGTGTVMEVAKGGGTPVQLASGQECPFGIAVDATSVYWSTTCAGALWRLAK